MVSYEYSPRLEIPNMSGNINTSLPCDFSRILKDLNPEADTVCEHILRGMISAGMSVDDIALAMLPLQSTQHTPMHKGFKVSPHKLLDTQLIPGGRTVTVHATGFLLPASACWVSTDQLLDWLLSGCVEARMAIDQDAKTLFANLVSHNQQIFGTVAAVCTIHNQEGEIISQYAYGKDAYDPSPPPKSMDKMFARWLTLRLLNSCSDEEPQWSGYGSWDSFLEAWSTLEPDTCKWTVRRLPVHD